MSDSEVPSDADDDVIAIPDADIIIRDPADYCEDFVGWLARRAEECGLDAITRDSLEQQFDTTEGCSGEFLIREPLVGRFEASCQRDVESLSCDAVSGLSAPDSCLIFVIEAGRA